MAAQSNFLEVSYLLIYGELPTKKQYDIFEREIMHHSIVHHDAANLFRAFRYNAHPMSILTSAFAAVGSFYEEVCCFVPRIRIRSKNHPVMSENLRIGQPFVARYESS